MPIFRLRQLREDDDLDEDVDDEEYDSEMDDFIDDSEFDEHLKRGDLEETLRYFFMLAFRFRLYTQSAFNFTPL